ncbi:MAG: di-heme-cytochrome C peroxidase [Pseudomonadota bacterium]
MIIKRILKKTTVMSASLLLGSLAIGVHQAGAAEPTYVKQGGWTDKDRKAFYVGDQGSRIMPLSWMRALKHDGQGFLEDALTRYGYLKLEGRTGAEDVPVGFTVATGTDGTPSIGMTCSACHTRQISVDGKDYRIDGGPAIVDFEAFLNDLVKAVDVAQGDGFNAFAKKVLGGNPTAADKAELKEKLAIWQFRFKALVEKSLPPEKGTLWGPARLDAITMIFNRLTGLDIGEGADDLIEGNMKPADAPTRYPFLWNAPRQDFTQWPGFAKNGNDLLGLARNLGEVYGVFGEFHPERLPSLIRVALRGDESKTAFRILTNRDFLKNNTANFKGLRALEDLVWKIGKPKWPFGDLDADKVKAGKDIFGWDTAKGGCYECHQITKGEDRPPQGNRPDTWATPILDVGTDAQECEILKRTVDTGIMNGARFLRDRLDSNEPAFKVLSMSVKGAILQAGLRKVKLKLENPRSIDLEKLFERILESNPELKAVPGMYGKDDKGAADAKDATAKVDATAPAWEPSGCKYESRVLEGIWAAAPYLHNGSVQSLRQLLEPASKREPSFKIGPNYDPKNAGLAAEQSKFGSYELKTTGCDKIKSGNSRCGHEYGTGLSGTQKEALLEYLKSL